MKPIMIGQAPGKTENGTLGPCSGVSFARMARVAGARDRDEELKFIQSFDRTNLLASFPGSEARGDTFPRRLAERAAERLRPSLHDRVVLMMGWNVAWAFDFMPQRGYLTWDYGFEVADTWRAAAVVPHPSGLNRWWNEEANREAARKFFDVLLGDWRETG